MTTTERRPAKFRAPQVMPRAGSSDGTAPLRSDPARVLHQVLFIAGVVLLPAGLIVIGFAWYGAAHTPYEYDQISYLVSGLFGLGMTFVGGFLYFGSWLARIGGEQKESQRQLSDTVLRLASSVSGSSAMSNGFALGSEVIGADGKRGQVRAVIRKKEPGAVLVVAGRGSTLHRADCGLISGRDDLRPVGDDTVGLTPCRLCQRDTTK